MLDFIKSMISDHPGSLSSIRFCLLFCFVLSNTIILVIWGILSLYHGYLQTVPESVVTLYCLANSIPLTGKVFQKHIEIKGRNIIDTERRI